MVVRQDEAVGIVDDGGTQNVARMGDGFVQGAAGNFHGFDETAFGIQQQDEYRLLVLKDKETVLVLLLDTKSRLIKPVEISSGTLNESIAHPRDILRPAVIHNAYGFVLAHNHPSGNPAPSRMDDLLTERVRECAKLLGVRFLDHVIIGKPTETVHRNYYSYNHPNGDRLREADKGLPLYH